MWYNGRCYGQTQEKTVSGHGGARTGAGKPKALAKTLSEAKETLNELQVLVKSGLKRAAAKFPELMDAEIETALKDENLDRKLKARQFLIKHLLDAIPVRDTGESPLRDILIQWNVKGDVHADMAGKGQGPIIDAKYRVVEGAE
jgi:hypothetical protein